MTHSKGLCLLVLAAMTATSSARADDDEPLAKRVAAGRRVLKRGSIASLRGHKVNVGGRQAISIGEIADDVLAEQRATAAELGAARAALLEPPVTVEEVIETDDDTIVTSSTSVVVTDPDALRARSKRFAKVRNKQRRDGFALSSLNAQQKREFADFRARMRQKPRNHPLRRAADAGDDALLDAVLEGKGDLTVSTTIVIPKKAPARTAKGTIRFAQADDNGDVDRSKSVERPSAFAGMAEHTRERMEVEVPGASTTIANGKSKHVAKFLTGFTEADDFVWEARWDFSFGFVSVKFHPWYEFGLRIPVEVTGILEPAKIVEKGPADKEVEFSVDLSARPVNGNAAFYAETGLKKDLIREGNEFLLGAGFEVIVHVKAGFIVNKKWVVPKKARFDWGQDFTPPFGNCNNGCGVDLWIPADVTRTKLSLLGIVTGSAQLGFKIGGTGTISADYEALFGDHEIPSWYPGRKAEAKPRQRIELAGASQKRTLKANAEAIPRAGVEREFGYRVSEPRYDWTVTVTPGVKGSIRVKAKPLLNDNFPIGPLWLKSLAIKLGTIKLDRHAGTKGAYKVKGGTKIWRDR